MAPTQKRSERTRRRLLDAAIGRFAEDGFAGASTRSIAEVAQVSEGLIFHYFPTKIDLLEAIAQMDVTVASVIREFLRGRAEAPTPEVLPGLMEELAAHLAPSRTVSQVFRVVLLERQTSPQLEILHARLTEEAIEALGGYLARRVEAGELRARLDIEAAARVLLGALLWTFLSLHAEEDARWLERARPAFAAALEHWMFGALVRG